MSVTSVDVVRVEGTEEGSGSVRNYVISYVVQTDDPTDGPKTVLASSSLPDIGDTYTNGTETDVDAVCIDIRPSPRVATRSTWDVTAEFTTSVPADFGEASNPLLRPVKISYGTGTRFEEISHRDADGKLIINSAGDLLHAIPRVKSGTTIIVVRNDDTQRVAHLDYQNAVNSDIFLGVFQPTTCRLSHIAISESLKENGQTYYEHRYVIDYDPRGWRLPVPDVGLRAKNPNAANAVMDILDARGQKVRVPAALDGTGFVEGTTPANGGSGNTNVLLAGEGQPIQSALDGVKLYEEIPFNPLGLL